MEKVTAAAFTLMARGPNGKRQGKRCNVQRHWSCCNGIHVVVPSWLQKIDRGMHGHSTCEVVIPRTESVRRSCLSVQTSNVTVSIQPNQVK
jgi:hypothetical protein